MTRLLYAVAVLLIFGPAVHADTTSTAWSIDAAHSSIGFSVRHLVVSKTKGSFGEFTGEISFDGKNLEKGTARITVQVSSIDTDDEKRDGHLKSPDFFDAEKYPTMQFKSKKVVPGKDGTFKLIGDLTIRDVTREVTFDGEFHGLIDDPWGNTRAGFTAQTRINRQDFNVTWNQTLDAGGVVVGDEVGINLELELIKSQG
jgi:polyisoprenoid-binding protein YceI